MKLYHEKIPTEIINEWVRLTEIQINSYTDAELSEVIRKEDRYLLIDRDFIYERTNDISILKDIEYIIRISSGFHRMELFFYYDKTSSTFSLVEQQSELESFLYFLGGDDKNDDYDFEENYPHFIIGEPFLLYLKAKNRDVIIDDIL